LAADAQLNLDTVNLNGRIAIGEFHAAFCPNACVPFINRSSH
jgi:hypothetical protein